MDKKNVQKLDDDMLENVSGGIYHYNPSYAILNGNGSDIQPSNAIMNNNVQVETKLVDNDIKAQVRNANNIHPNGAGNGFNPAGGTFV